MSATKVSNTKVRKYLGTASYEYAHIHGTRLVGLHECYTYTYVYSCTRAVRVVVYNVLVVVVLLKIWSCSDKFEFPVPKVIALRVGLRVQ